VPKITNRPLMVPIRGAVARPGADPAGWAAGSPFGPPQAAPPAWPESGQQNPEQSVGWLEAQTARCALLQDGDLVTQSKDFGL